jgi:hypothetical protein
MYNLRDPMINPNTLNSGIRMGMQPYTGSGVTPPMSQVPLTGYSPPLNFNRPQEVVGGYEPNIDPYTGQERFAGGGQVRHFYGGDFVDGYNPYYEPDPSELAVVDPLAANETVPAEGGFYSSSGVLSTPNSASGGIYGMGAFTPDNTSGSYSPAQLVNLARDYIAAHPEVPQNLVTAAISTGLGIPVSLIRPAVQFVSGVIGGDPFAGSGVYENRGYQDYGYSGLSNADLMNSLYGDTLAVNSAPSGSSAIDLQNIRFDSSNWEGQDSSIDSWFTRNIDDEYFGRSPADIRAENVAISTAAAHQQQIQDDTYDDFTSPLDNIIVNQRFNNDVRGANLPYAGYTGFSGIMSRGGVGGFSGQPLSYFDASGENIFLLPDGSIGSQEEQARAYADLARQARVAAAVREAEEGTNSLLSGSSGDGLENIIVTGSRDTTTPYGLGVQTPITSTAGQYGLTDTGGIPVGETEEETEERIEDTPNVLVPGSPAPAVSDGTESTQQPVNTGLIPLAYKKNWGRAELPTLGTYRQAPLVYTGTDTSSGMSFRTYSPSALQDYTARLSQFLRAPQTAGVGDVGYQVLPGEEERNMAAGGIASLPEYRAGGKLLRGPGDGMSDSIPAVIKGNKPQRAALADGEFVIPADVVSHLGNGSTEAGAKTLYAMMDRIRQARTGQKKQAPAVKASKFLPK